MNVFFQRKRKFNFHSKKRTPSFIPHFLPSLLYGTNTTLRQQPKRGYKYPNAAKHECQCSKKRWIKVEKTTLPQETRWTLVCPYSASKTRFYPPYCRFASIKLNMFDSAVESKHACQGRCHFEGITSAWRHDALWSHDIRMRRMNDKTSITQRSCAVGRWILLCIWLFRYKCYDWMYIFIDVYFIYYSAGLSFMDI